MALCNSKLRWLNRLPITFLPSPNANQGRCTLFSVTSSTVMIPEVLRAMQFQIQLNTVH